MRCIKTMDPGITCAGHHKLKINLTTDIRWEAAVSLGIVGSMYDTNEEDV
jgi:hypothetical protein